MNARSVIEAETPKKALRALNDAPPNAVSLDDADVHWQQSGTREYPDHWQAMWNFRFTRRHPEIRGCPLGVSAILGERGQFMALNDLVNRTNRESGTDFFIRLRESRHVIEAVLHPDQETMAAYLKARSMPDSPERAELLRKHQLVFDPDYVPHADPDLTVHVSGQKSANYSPDDDLGSLRHELVHREQFRRAGKNASLAASQYARATTRHGELDDAPDDATAAKIFKDHLRHPWELMAMAQETAVALRRDYGDQALEMARRGKWKRYYTTGAEFVADQFGGGSAVVKRFLKYLLAYLSQPERG